MALPIINNWRDFFTNYDEGLGSTYERVILNELLTQICTKYSVKSVLESPCFGFTGITGINSMGLVRDGLEVTVIDHNGERLGYIDSVWEECKLSVKTVFSDKYMALPFLDREFDFTWNFSALWFLNDLEKGLSELNRVTSKVILLVVPNRTGLGYIWQKLVTPVKGELNLKNIKPKSFLPIMAKMNWELIDDRLIDCPPWPDIGMKKEKLLKMIGLYGLLDRSDDKGDRVSIIDYYTGLEPDLPANMKKYYWFERILPPFLKKFWAHHHYYLFVRSNNV